MQMGYNTDIEHRGLIVHIQTEDHGMGDRKITTQVFFSGRILDSRTISYAEAIDGVADEDARDVEITRRMRAMHKHFHNKIRSGEYDPALPLEDALIVAAAAAEEEPEPADVVEHVIAVDLSAFDLPTEGSRAYRGIDNEDESTGLATLLRAALAV